MPTQAITTVYNLIILDESGSMEAIKGATITGFNELLQSIRHSMKAHPALGQLVNYYSFNGGGIRELLPLCPATHLNFLTPEAYQPGNMTPLYDALGVAVTRLKHKLEGEKGYRVLVTILTDGEENASQEYTQAAIASLVGELEQKGWLFTYIGANHDVAKTAVSLNIHNHMSFVASEEGTIKMFSKTQRSRERYMDQLKKGKDGNRDYFN